MEADLDFYEDGDLVMAEFELDGDIVIDSNAMQPGATVFVSNETNMPLVGNNGLAQFFEVQGGEKQIVGRSMAAEPRLIELVQEVNGNIDFDPEAEEQKLREFLSGVELEPLPESIPATSQSLSIRLVMCANCNGIFDTPAFQKHCCDFDANQKPIPAQQPQPQPERKVVTPPSGSVPSSERIIVENQVRMRRYMKDELKYDLEAGCNTAKAKESAAIKGPNECSICDRKFVHSSGLVRHMEKHALDLIPSQPTTQHQNASTSKNGIITVLKCKHCGRVFFNVKQALEHILVHESESKEFSQVCTEDKASLKQQLKQFAWETQHLLPIMDQLEQMDDRFSIHVMGNVLQCEFCDYIFADVAALLRHSSTHLPERRFECNACDQRLSTSKEAVAHYQTDCIYMREELKQLPTIPTRLFVCNVCQQKFANLDVLLEHRYACLHFFPRLNGAGTRLMIPCEFCPTNFLCASEIPLHYEEKHLNRKKRDKEQLRNSTNPSASKARLRQYLCDICGKSYTQSSHLWQHLRFHQGVKPFVCPEANCGRKFTIRPDLNDHIRKCHTGERPYHCLVCGKRFLTGSVFYQHRLIHRGERRYECEECGKRFYRADALKNHQRIHTGEKPYDCPFCTKTFRQRGDRDKHVRARHSHLDENARLMMRLQKYELEQAAALKAKQMQEVGVEYHMMESGETMSAHLVASPMAQEPQYEPQYEYTEYVEEPEPSVMPMPMPASNEAPIDTIPYVECVKKEKKAKEQLPFPLEDNDNVKVVVVENTAAQPFYF